jgi:hypothetical protein
MNAHHHKQVDLGCLSMATNHLFAPSLYAACMKRINTQIDVILHNGFRGKCHCRSDFADTIAPIECQHGGAVCLSAGGSPPDI